MAVSATFSSPMAAVIVASGGVGFGKSELPVMAPTIDCANTMRSGTRVGRRRDARGRVTTLLVVVKMGDSPGWGRKHGWERTNAKERRARAEVARPSAAVARPDAGSPGRPNAAVVRPKAEVARPNAAVVRPNAEVARPNAAVARPKAEVARPNAAVVRPNAEVARPNAAVARPNAAVARPNAAVARPNAAVARPNAEVGRPNAAGIGRSGCAAARRGGRKSPRVSRASHPRARRWSKRPSGGPRSHASARDHDVPSRRARGAGERADPFAPHKGYRRRRADLESGPVDFRK